MQKLRGSGDPGRRHRELIWARIYLPRPPLPGHYMLQKRAQGETIKCFRFGGSLWAVSLYRLIGHGLMRLHFVWCWLVELRLSMLASHGGFICPTFLLDCSSLC